MQCPHCRATVPEGETLCGVCGNPIDAPASGAPVPDSSSGPVPIPFSNEPASASRPPRPEGMIGGSLSEGWRAFKMRPGLMVGMLVVLFVISGIANSIISELAAKNLWAMQTVSFAWSLFQNVIAAGYLYAGLRLIRGEEVGFSLLFSGFNRLVPLLIATFVSTISIFVGLFFLLIPGLILTLGLSQYVLLIMDRERNGMESLSESWALMRGYKWTFFGLGLAIIGINLLGVLALGVGLLVSIPTSMLAACAFYDRLAGGPESEA